LFNKNALLVPQTWGKGMGRKSYTSVETPTLLKIEPCDKHEWIASVQTQDGILIWFGINESHAIFKIGCRRVLGKGDNFSNHFMAARMVAVVAIREAQKKQKVVVDAPPRKPKVVLLTWHHKYEIAG